MVCKDLGARFISSSDRSSNKTFSISEQIIIGITTIIHKCMYIMIFIFFFISFTLKIKTRSFWVHDNFYVPLSIGTAVVGFAYWLLVRSNFLPHVPRYYLAQLHPNNFLLWFYLLFNFLTVLSVTPALPALCVCTICTDLLIGLLNHFSPLFLGTYSSSSSSYS